MSKSEGFTRDEARALLAGGAPDAADWDVVSRLLLDRFSCRAFLPQPVPRQTLEEIFAAAQFSPSWCNAQGWQLIVTQGAATERLREALFAKAGEASAGSQPDIPFPAAYEGVFGQRRREAGVALYESAGITRQDKTGAVALMRENYRLFGAPHAAILTVEADLGTYGVLDCGIYLGNLLQLLQSRGIASIAQGALPRFAPLLRDHFDIPANRRIVCGISFGYADPASPLNQFRTTRARTDAAVQWCDS